MNKQLKSQLEKKFHILNQDKQSKADTWIFSIKFKKNKKYD